MSSTGRAKNSKYQLPKFSGRRPTSRLQRCIVRPVYRLALVVCSKSPVFHVPSRNVGNGLPLPCFLHRGRPGLGLLRFWEATSCDWCEGVVAALLVVFPQTAFDAPVRNQPNQRHAEI